MISEEIILDRERVDCIVRELQQLLEVKSHYQFKLLFSKDEDGSGKLVIIPHSFPIEITL